MTRVSPDTTPFTIAWSQRPRLEATDDGGEEVTAAGAISKMQVYGFLWVEISRYVLIAEEK